MQEARSTPSRVPLFAYMKIRKAKKKRGKKTKAEVDDEFFDKAEAMEAGAMKEGAQWTHPNVGEELQDV